LLQLAALHLNNGEIDTCIDLAKKALKFAQKIMTENYEKDIKIFEILCRAYEIKG
jgi:hypothetical protein